MKNCLSLNLAMIQIHGTVVVVYLGLVIVDVCLHGLLMPKGLSIHQVTLLFIYNKYSLYIIYICVGVGVRVGRDSRLNYLIVQVHYNKLVNQADNLSSYKITLTTQEYISFFLNLF